MVGRVVRLASSPPPASRIKRATGPTLTSSRAPTNTSSSSRPGRHVLRRLPRPFHHDGDARSAQQSQPPKQFRCPSLSRPNMIIKVSDDVTGFVENEWVGRTIAIGDEVRLMVTHPCPRCVMTTLPQYDLPQGPECSADGRPAELGERRGRRQCLERRAGPAGGPGDGGRELNDRPPTEMRRGWQV